MRKSDPIRLRHALEAAQKAVRFTQSMSAQDLERDDKTSLATLHAIALVGEALNQVSAEFQGRYPDIPWKHAIGMRNRLIHGYDDVDHARVLDTVRSNLPPLIKALEKALDDADA
jgi:uncharacterized protein with HEPN domain